jgi:hypothetical protein
MAVTALPAVTAVTSAATFAAAALALTALALTAIAFAAIAFAAALATTFIAAALAAFVAAAFTFVAAATFAAFVAVLAMTVVARRFVLVEAGTTSCAGSHAGGPRNRAAGAEREKRNREKCRQALLHRGSFSRELWPSRGMVPPATMPGRLTV